MQYHFDGDLAGEYGILEAVLLDNLSFWIKKNMANGKNLYDGSYWTYNSTKAFAELFPFASPKQIRRALQHLQDEGLVKSGNYNQNGYDRTLWYALTDLGLDKTGLAQKGKSICPNGQMEVPKWANGFAQTVTPIPDTKPDNEKPDEVKPDNGTELNEQRAREAFDRLWEVIPTREIVESGQTHDEQLEWSAPHLVRIKEGAGIAWNELEHYILPIFGGKAYRNISYWLQDHADEIIASIRREREALAKWRKF